jgi:hypothetical protein
MAHEQHRIQPTHGTQERIDRLVASTMRRFITIVISASSLAVIVCCLGAIR